jgi:hypothetical protein
MPKAITTKIRLKTNATRLEQNTDKYNEGESVTAVREIGRGQIQRSPPQPWRGKKEDILQNTYAQHLFRRVRNIAKSDYQFRHACLSVCSHGTIRLPLDGFS